MQNISDILLKKYACSEKCFLHSLGTSLINYLIYTRGNRPDYDMWAEQGNIGWSYNDVLPYFLKSEDIRVTELFDKPNHRRGGLLPVEHLRHKTKLGSAFLEAGKEMGKILSSNRELNWNL